VMLIRQTETVSWHTTSKAGGGNWTLGPRSLPLPWTATQWIM